MAKFKLAINGKEREFEATRQGNNVCVIVDGKTAVFQLKPHAGQLILLEQARPDGTRKQIKLAGAKNGDTRQLWVNGRTLNIERVRERGSGSQGNASLTASIPAVVTQILVSEGETVSEGDKLILLESMKMVIPIQAPYDGVVTAVSCTQGESVQAGIQLIELEEITN